MTGDTKPAKLWGAIPLKTDERCPKDQLHVVPQFAGEREHEASADCWCKPRQDVEQSLLWVHNRRAEA